MEDDCAELWRSQIHDFLLSEGKQHLGFVARCVPRPSRCMEQLSKVVRNDPRFQLWDEGASTLWIDAAPAPRQLQLEDCWSEQWRCQIHSFLLSEGQTTLSSVAKCVLRPLGCTAPLLKVVNDDPQRSRFILEKQGATTWLIDAAAAPEEEWEEDMAHWKSAQPVDAPAGDRELIRQLKACSSFSALLHFTQAVESFERAHVSVAFDRVSTLARGGQRMGAAEQALVQALLQRAGALAAAGDFAALDVHRALTVAGECGVVVGAVAKGHIIARVAL
ncbi:hypothetical protein T484DRAFT_1772177, partial [Baffinella frigidus]